MFNRWLFLPKKKSILLIGPRRSGKTTFLRSTFLDYAYATLDDYDQFSWAKSDPKGFLRQLGGKMIIDEIQRWPALTIAVKYAIDENGARVLMSGSSSLGLLDATADTLAGRIEILSLPTACWGEERGAPTHDVFHEQADSGQILEASRLLKSALEFGQFPEIIGFNKEEEKRLLLRNYRDTYFLRDLMQLANLENADGLRAILLHLSRSVGSHLEISTFAREAAVSVPTAKKYLAALAQSQLVFKLYGYQFGPAKRFLKAAKSYFSDIGIMQSLNAQPSSGQVMENFVLAELEKRRKLGYIFADQIFFYKSAGGRELDCVIENQGKLMIIEIKASARVGEADVRHIRAFIRDCRRSAAGYLFYTGLEYQTIDGINIIPIAALWRGK